MNEHSSPQIKKYIPLKLEPIYFSIIKIPQKNNDPILVLLEDSLKVSKNTSNLNNLFKTLIRKIVINKKQNMNLLSKYFNRNIYINKNFEITNFPNFIDFIFEMNNNLNHENDLLKKFILSKIIIESINYYQKNNSFKNTNDTKLIKIENQNKLFVKNNAFLLDKFKIDINKENIDSTNIEELYENIIISIIQKFNFEKHEKFYDKVANQLELNLINFSDSMIKNIFEFLISNDSNIKKNTIKHVNDLFEPRKIHFYYFLLNYIIKSSIYIYHIPFLLKTRKTLLKIIKSKLNKIFAFNINNLLKEKIIFIVKKLADSDYYFKKFLNYFYLKEIYDYYKTFYFEAKKEEIKNIDTNYIKKYNKKLENNILKDLKIAKKMNIRASFITYLFSQKQLNSNSEKRNELYKYVEKWEKLENFLNNKQFKKIKRNIKLKLANYFSDENNKKELEKIFNKEIYKLIKQKSKEFLKEEKDKYSINFQDNSTKNNINNSNENKKNIKTKENDNIINVDKDSKNEGTNIIIESEYIYNSSSINNESFLVQENNSASKNIQMLKFVKIIGKHENRAEFIKEIDNNYLVSGGADKKLLLYNNDLKILFEIKEKKWIYNALPYGKNFLKSTQIITCSSDKLFISEIDYRLREINEEMDISNCLNILELKNNDYMVLGNESLGIITNLNSKIIYNRKTVLDNKTFKGAIVINENEAVFTSNNILKNGGDVLVFFSMIEKKIKNEIKGYSFVNTVNGLTLIQREKKDGSILLCACKKYISGQKNGILLLNFKEDGKKEFNFYDTNNFEVYCFCPISVKKNTYILSDERNKRYYTDYFFVGGFDKDKKRGALKLYQIENEEANFKIKNINNIDFEDSIVFKNPISCIIQFRNTDNLLIASLDGNISQFKFDLNYILYINSQRRIIINA